MSEINIESINNAASDYSDMISKAEESYYSHLKNIAKAITEKSKVRVILLAGPSSSGKTTTANILRDELSTRGYNSAVVSLDDFYLNGDDEAYPKFEDGSRNMECAEALDTKLIHSCLKEVIASGATSIPEYDFKTASRKSEYRNVSIPNGGYLIVEGLHALNPIISDGIDRDGIFKLFVSVSTNINENGKRILSGRKIRFIRRLSRDNIYRGASAQRTLSLWKSVLDSEDIYLYPYKDTADSSMNTFHIYELGVLKTFALQALSEITAQDNEYAGMVLSALEKIVAIPLEAVPENSLIREFVPGGIYEELY